ncbi:hypothetical protein HMPREF0491_00076, partial [Lachnospiraceae oral taxon 107 str. F0167]
MDNQSITHTRWNCTYHIVLYQNTEEKSCMEKQKRI